MDNINGLDKDGLTELGKQVQDAISKMMHLRNNYTVTFPTMVRELLTFENRDNGANEWVQVNISCTYEPVYFNDDSITALCWLPIELGNEITTTFMDGLQAQVKLLQEANVDKELINRFIDVAEDSLYIINGKLFCK